MIAYKIPQYMGGIENDAKTIKGKYRNVLTLAVYFSPSDRSGIADVCKYATPGCKASCLDTAGHGSMNSVQIARTSRTDLFFHHRSLFDELLFADHMRLMSLAEQRGLMPASRLNATADLPWERIPFTVGKEKYRNIMEVFPDIQFYDYTKWPIGLRRNLPVNYDITFSLAETQENHRHAEEWLDEGKRVSIVVNILSHTHAPLPTGLWGLDTTDGDIDDCRFLDPKDKYVLLRAKGKAVHDTTGFVLDLATVSNITW